MYNPRTVKEFLYYSIEIKKMQKQLKTIQLVKNIGIDILSGYDNPLYLELLLEEIKITKKLFMYSVELGEETIIPSQIY